MTATPLELLFSKLPNAKKSGKGWSVQCPAHEDCKPSLSITEGDDGRALVKCHAGCTAEAVCNAVGLKLADLMPSDSIAVATATQLQKTPNNGQHSKRGSGTPAKSYNTAKSAVAALERKHGKRSSLWTYCDADGDPVGVIVRWDKDGGKDIRPVARHDDRWTIGGMPAPRPLYHLPDLASADRVYITEGEKAADAACAIGLTATTSAHGSQSADKTDWSSLAAKDCVLLPDHDQPGGKYAATVAAILAQLTPPAVVRVVELPDLPDHGDMADWVEARTDATPGALRKQVEDLANTTQPVHAEEPTAGIEQFKPFPTDWLPEPVQSFVVKGAAAIGCDSSYLALPLLTALAAAIGNARRIQLKQGWSAPAIIWTAIVGESGTAKTPAFKLVMQPVRNRQRKSLEFHDSAMEDYKSDLAIYDKQFSAWKRDQKTGGPPPQKPEPPPSERFIVSDVTVEAIAPLLQANPRGLLLSRDELAGWIGSFDRYTGGKGSADAAHWLSMHNGEEIVVDRKTGNPPTICVPMASVSVTGGIQPAILDRALGIEHRESGLAARILLTCPPRKPKRWTEADIDPADEAVLARLFDRLYQLQFSQVENGNLQPVVIGMLPDAKLAWTEYYNQHAQEQIDLSGDLSAAWSKLEEYAARLALVLHYVRWAAGDAEAQIADAIDADSMRAGIVLAQWFKSEARRVYALLSESDEDHDQRRLIEWIERKGKPVTVREVQQGHRQYRTAQDAEAALEQLAKAGCGQWHDAPPGPKGGRPSHVFRLSTASTSTQPARTRDSEGFVDVDSADAPKTDSDQDWAEV